MGILGGFSGFLTEYCYGGRPPSSYNHPREELALTLEHLAAIVGIVEPETRAADIRRPIRLR